MKTLRLLIVPMVLWIALLSVPREVLADEYDDSQSHPLRVVAYIFHPVGVFLEWAVARPLHDLVSGTKEREHLFGHRPHPPIFPDPLPSYDFGVSKGVPVEQVAPPKKTALQEPASEKVIIKEIPVEKIVVKEVPKVVEVEKIVEVERVIFPDVAFRFDSAQLTDLGKGRVYLAAQKLKEKSDLIVVIQGHADYIGSEQYNQSLGLRRAETVIKELTKMGVDPGRMSVASLGESKPIIEQKTDWARAVNRRVEFRIRTR